MSATAESTTLDETQHFHDTTPENYARLVAMYGERESNGTRWVTIGAGSYRLVFFAPREARA